MFDVLLIFGAGVLAVAIIIGLVWFFGGYLVMYRWKGSLKEPGGQA